ncbi:MAG: 50S ribosomal protein L35 [Deltaproteobacteria bacterium]|nr:50S ribosomal protein L35 [Deltaproteobacteria bacterium]
MPKMKTNSSSKKRFRFTGTGKAKRASARKSHILTKKTTKMKRRLRGTSVIDKTNMIGLARLMPYGRR